MHQQLVTAFANGFTDGDNFASITSARKLAQSVLNQKIEPGTPEAKIVDESIEQGLVLAARQLVQQFNNPLETWEQCLDLYEPASVKHSHQHKHSPAGIPHPCTYCVSSREISPNW